MKKFSTIRDLEFLGGNAVSVQVRSPAPKQGDAHSGIPLFSHFVVLRILNPVQAGRKIPIGYLQEKRKIDRM